MPVFDKQNSVIFSRLELIHRHDADAEGFPVIVHKLILDDRLIQRCFGARIVAPLFPQLTKPLFDSRAAAQQPQVSGMVARAFELVSIGGLKSLPNSKPILCR